MLQNLLLLSRKACGNGSSTGGCAPPPAAFSSSTTMLPLLRPLVGSNSFQRDASSTAAAATRSSSSSSSSSSGFTPNPPPVTKGTPVFPDIDLQRPPSADAVLRNSDDQAVFVVTGASRGIGQQIVTSLLERTQVRACVVGSKALAMETHWGSCYMGAYEF